MIKKLLLLSLFSIAYAAEKPEEKRYYYHTIMLKDGTIITYVVDNTPEGRKKIDSQFGPSQGYPTQHYGNK